MPKGDKICDETVFSDSQASGQTPNLAFTLRFLLAYQRQTVSAKVSNFTFQKKCINGELGHVGFRDAE